MIIKKFQGKSEADAVESAKKELGNNVVIMNVRSVKRKGLFSFLMPQLTEVTVALEDEPERIQAAKKEPASPAPEPASRREAAPLVPARADHLLPGEGILIDDNTPLKDISLKGEERRDNNAIEEKLDSLQTLLEQQLVKPDEVKAEPVEEEKESELERFMKLLYNTMLDNEVSEQYANQIIDEIEKTNKPNMPFDYVLANIYQKMILKFEKPVVIQPAEKGPRVVFFVGPTGVGKTTTIAKIASRFRVEEGKKVVLFTTDTYRIAAAEQFRTYANIMEVPFRVIYSEDELKQSLEEFKDYDFVLVDTAGHSHKNEAQKEIMNGFLHALEGIAEKEVFLVLSATTKYRDLVIIADSYSAMTKYNLIFTKVDETMTLGNLLNIKLYTGASMSYVTYGQNVPDDIEDFNPQKTVKQLLGGKKS